MATFSQDQVRQFYVVKAIDTITTRSGAGTVEVVNSAEDIWLKYVTPNGGLGAGGVTTSIVRSDLIPIKNIEYAAFTEPKKTLLPIQEVVLDSSINSGNPVVGQEYILRFTFYGIGVGGPSNQYIKNGGAYKVKQGDTAAVVLENLAELAKINFSREPFPYVQVVTDTYNPYTDSSKPGTSTKLVIKSVPQPWIRGKRQADVVQFDTHCVAIDTTYGQYPWGTVTKTTSNSHVQGNGKTVADMEWFYIGERADQFREAGYPDNFVTAYLADPTKEYYFADIHYFYQGDAEDIQKSKKYITLAIEAKGDGTEALAEAVQDALETAGVVWNAEVDFGE